MKIRLFYRISILLLTLWVGAMVTGCDTPIATGWVTRSDGTFYRDAEGAYVSGWQDIDGNRYYFNEPDRIQGEDYVMVTGWLDFGEDHFFLDENGIMQTGWVRVDGHLLCFGQDGRMLTGWTEKDGKRCYLQSDGTLGSGWLNEGGLTYYLDENGTPVTGWQDIDGNRYYFQENGCMLVGWAKFSAERYYFREDGSMQTGWADIDGSRYCFTENGSMMTGWVEDNANRYYLLSDGTMAQGTHEIDGVTCHFSRHGIYVPLVNPWHALPDGFEADLSYIDEKQRIATSCYEQLMKMLADCEAAGHIPIVVSAYRTNAEQEFLYYRKVDYFLDMDYSRYWAEKEAAKVVAVPGTSEHQLGLAVDIVDENYPYLDDYQANTAAQKWLMEHCHEYGFILRYPVGTTDITGIIYEPWHYRYVGIEVAQDIREQGVTLEEYLDAVETE